MRILRVIRPKTNGRRSHTTKGRVYGGIAEIVVYFDEGQSKGQGEL